MHLLSKVCKIQDALQLFVYIFTYALIFYAHTLRAEWGGLDLL